MLNAHSIVRTTALAVNARKGFMRIVGNVLIADKTANNALHHLLAHHVFLVSMSILVRVQYAKITVFHAPQHHARNASTDTILQQIHVNLVQTRSVKLVLQQTHAQPANQAIHSLTMSAMNVSKDVLCAQSPALGNAMVAAMGTI